MNQLDFVRDYVENLCNVLHNLLPDDFVPVLKVLEKAHSEQRQVFLAGNGGSAATALHMANDLMKSVANRGGQGFRAIALSDNISTITAIANDENYAEIFTGQLMVLAQSGDVLIVFSASGNSQNIIRAVELAHQMQLKTIGFLGMGIATQFWAYLHTVAKVDVIVPALGTL